MNSGSGLPENFLSKRGKQIYEKAYEGRLEWGEAYNRKFKKSHQAERLVARRNPRMTGRHLGGCCSSSKAFGQFGWSD
jgi:hypothetical protein